MHQRSAYALMSCVLAAGIVHGPPAHACTADPRVQTLPGDGDTDVPTNTRILRFGLGKGAFGSPQDITLHGPDGPIDTQGTRFGDNRLWGVILTPVEPLLPDTEYTVEVASPAESSTFRTGSGPDDTAPPMHTVEVIPWATDGCNHSSCGGASLLQVSSALKRHVHDVEDPDNHRSTLLRVLANKPGESARFMGLVPGVLGRMWGIGMVDPYEPLAAFSPVAPVTGDHPVDWSIIGETWCVTVQIEDLAGNVTGVVEEQCATFQDPFTCTRSAVDSTPDAGSTADANSSAEVDGEVDGQADTDDTGGGSAVPGTQAGGGCQVGGPATANLWVLFAMFVALGWARRRKTVPGFSG